MWSDLPVENKEEYKRLILAFASLTEMFTQKADSGDIPSPIINSKFQETAFQKAFNASAEDIGNTSFDAALILKDAAGKTKKYLIGIKTFGINSGDQKIAQFKANHDEWSDLINIIKSNSIDEDGNNKSTDEINHINHDNYTILAKKISHLRNTRIESSKENLRGFKISESDENIYSIYHVLMPSKKGDSPKIYVGETNYNKIDIENIEVIGCTSAKNPTNFVFTDGIHTYKFTSADSQLLMKFNNSEIVKDEWDVIYADDAYSIFAEIANRIYGKENEVIESYSWSLLNKYGEVELFTGFNSSFAIGQKLGKTEREKRISKIYEKYKNQINSNLLNKIINKLHHFLMDPAPSMNDKMDKVKLRYSIQDDALSVNNSFFLEEINKLLYRPVNELYIPIPNAKEFHSKHPDFFGLDIGRFKDGTDKLLLEPENRTFNLVFEPSGDTLLSYVTQSSGKAIESFQSQSFLGEWILRKVFQLNEYEPLTAKKLNEIEINGIRLYKMNNSNDIHLEFIWIDEQNPPKDYIQKIR